MTKTTSAFSIAEGFIANRLETLNFYKTFVHIWWSPFFSLFFFFSLNFSLFEISVTIHCLIDFYLSRRTLLKDKMAANRKFLCMSF